MIAARHGKTIAASKKVVHRNPDIFGARIIVTVTYSSVVREEEARAAADGGGNW